MSVQVRLPALLRSHVGGVAVVDAQGTTVGEVFADLVAQFPGLAGQLIDSAGALHKFVNVYIDDEDIRYLEQLDTKIADGAMVSVLPAVAGG